MLEPEYADYDAEERVELEPFARFNWKTAESRDMWKALLERAEAAKHEAEWRSVMDDRTDRRCAIIHVNNYNREKWLRRVGRHGLEYRDIRYSEQYEGFSHKFFPTSVHNPNRNTYAVIADDPDVADLVEEVENEGQGRDRHDTVGEMLGFPECCREFFNDVWLDGYERGLTDPMYEVACNTPSAEAIDGPENVRLTDPDAYTNNLWRYFGWSFITHIPCSFECEESIRIGQVRRQIMEEQGYEDAAEALYTWLDQPHVWDGLHSIANVRNKHVTGTAGTSSYWSKKRVEWRRKHLPQMKDHYTQEDLTKIQT